MLVIPVWLWVIIGFAAAIFIVVTVVLSIRTHRNKAAAGKEELVGTIATAETELNPRGIVLVEGERWTAILDSGRAEPEEELVITKVDGLKLNVTKK